MQMHAHPQAAAGDGLVQLNRTPRRCPATWKERAVSGPVVDKFFALGALFGFVGTVGYGAYLWLVLNNFLPMTSSYPELRYAHAVVQVYLFFGLFVLGFLSQAGGKMLGAEVRFGKRPLLVLPVYAAGAFAMLAGLPWGAVVVSSVFLLYGGYLAYCCLQGCARPLQAVLTVTGLFVLAVSPYLSLQSPVSALLLMWGGFGTLIFAAAGQFLAAFLGGRNLAGRWGAVFVLLHLSSVAVMAAGAFSELPIAAAAALASLTVYLIATDARSWFRSLYPNPLGLAFVCGFVWAFSAWLLALFGGMPAPDLTVHLLAVGWAAPLIFAVSAQVMGFLTGRQCVLPRRTWWWLLLAWQLVPLGRGAFHTAGLPAWFAVVTVGVSFLVFTSWTAALCGAAWQLMRAQAVLKQGEQLASCG